MNSLLDRIRVVLSSTTHPGNIGSTARAMKAMGLSRLVLVAPRRFPDPEATALASGADDLLARAVVCGTLDEALAGTSASYALTARRRELSHPPYAVRDAARNALEEARSGDVAFVFGTEMSGLSNEDVLRCRATVHIPADPRFSSLNLSQAVQIVAYEIWSTATGGAVPRPPEPPAATHEDIEHLYTHLERAVTAAGFLDPANPRRLMERMRRLFGRARLEREEVNILRGMLAALESPQIVKRDSPHAPGS